MVWHIMWLHLHHLCVRSFFHSFLLISSPFIIHLCMMLKYWLFGCVSVSKRVGCVCVSFWSYGLAWKVTFYTSCYFKNYIIAKQMCWRQYIPCIFFFWHFISSKWLASWHVIGWLNHCYFLITITSYFIFGFCLCFVDKKIGQLWIGLWYWI